MHMIEEAFSFAFLTSSDALYDPPLMSSVLMNGNSILSAESNLSYDSPMTDDYIIQNLETKLEKWTNKDLMNWIVETCEQNGRNYEDMNLCYFNKFTGMDILRLSVQDFLQASKTKSYSLASFLYRKFQELADTQTTDDRSFTYSPHHFNDMSVTTENLTHSSGSDGEAEPVVQKRQRGRPKSSTKVRRKSEHKTGKLWEFLRDLLLNPDYCPAIICWENYEEGVFKFVSSEKVAKLWGSKRGNNVMNYEKLSRAMRYYYKTQVLAPVLGKRLVYRFGINAKGWHTDNPNFLKPC